MRKAVKKIKKRIYSNWKTTVLGIIIILASVVSVFTVPGMTWWPQGSIGIFVGILLWLAPDRIIGVITGFFRNNKVSVDNTNSNTPPDQLQEP